VAFKTLGEDFQKTSDQNWNALLQGINAGLSGFIKGDPSGTYLNL